MANTAYTVIKTEPFIYLDALNNPVNGFRVTFEKTATREVFFVTVPRLESAQVKAAVEALLKQVDEIAKL